MQETSKRPQQVHLAVPVTNAVPQSALRSPAPGSHGSSGAPCIRSGLEGTFKRSSSPAPCQSKVTYSGLDGTHLFLHFNANHQTLPEAITELLGHLGMDYCPLQLYLQCSLQLSPSSASHHHLLLYAEAKDGGWRDRKVSKGNGQSILTSCIFAV